MTDHQAMIEPPPMIESVEPSVVDYRSDPHLDAELAALIYTAVHGWADQRPWTSALVRSLLRPAGMTATSLALYRDPDGTLVGAAALRWPSTVDMSGRAWGPVVHPDHRRRGIGTALLSCLAELLSRRPGTRVLTAEIPAARTFGWSLYERAGWLNSGVSQLLSRRLEAAEATETTEAAGPADGSDDDVVVDGVSVRGVRPGEYLDQALAALVAEVRPHLGHAMARDTYARWTADARYTPDGLLLAEGPDGLCGVALVYPLTNPELGEPNEALIADMLISPGLTDADAAPVRSALVAAALRTGAAHGAVVARAVVDSSLLADSLRAAGFVDSDEIRYYEAPSTGAAG